MQPYKKILRETLPPVLYRALKAAKRSKKPR
jgi:hypothetical protein